jgi:phosphoribosylamine--glycine ligase
MGSGAREHAIAWAIAKDCKDVFILPGNPGVNYLKEQLSNHPQNIYVFNEDINRLKPDLVIIGPETPLCEGIADRLRQLGYPVVGPDKKAANLECSKAFMKNMLKRCNIPTAEFKIFSDLKRAKEFIKSQQPPYVIKTDGLAAGKGVLVTYDQEEALCDLEDKLSGRSFGAAGKTVIIEKAMLGPELSLMVLCDAKRIEPFVTARDYKRVFDKNVGPNTGGMGAYGPIEEINEEKVCEILEKCIEPLIKEFNKQSVEYKGVLYAGLMLTESGPKVVEFNVRMGDPEAQVVTFLAEENLLEVFVEVASGNLNSRLSNKPKFGVNIVLAAEGYPANPIFGAAISGIDKLDKLNEARIFSSGIDIKEGIPVVSGGRVLSVCALGNSLKEARAIAYDLAGRIEFAGRHFRSDIASG